MFTAQGILGELLEAVAGSMESVSAFREFSMISIMRGDLPEPSHLPRRSYLG